MRAVGKYLVLHGGSYASLFGLYFSVSPLNGERSVLHWVFLALSALVALFVLFNGARQSWRERERIYKGTQAINAYMSGWISMPGRTVILSRDLSWGSNYTSKNALVKKAKAQDLIILIHKPTQLTKELEALGAKVFEYSLTGHQPRSRFTVIGFGKEGSKVAVGITSGEEHRVFEYRSGEHPIAAIAEDLVRFLAKGV